MITKTGKKDPLIHIAVVDDHRLFRVGLINLIHSLGENFSVMMEAVNGKVLLDLLQEGNMPEIVILDVEMPIMDGYQTAKELHRLYPGIHVLVITMLENETTLIKMLQAGVKGYLSKDVEPGELKTALLSISNRGYYYTDYVTGKLINAMQTPDREPAAKISLSEKELIFLRYACSEYTYKEIADMMGLSIKTIDGYRNSLFEKLNVKSRTGLAIYALKNHLVNI